mmetsp:Transcript_138218/g.440955  ORF Transcript_138218/g.440955 Transcript_138218/m.440955 type:complete len:232 (-) Transcript_138218:362-1057(-)
MMTLKLDTRAHTKINLLITIFSIDEVADTFEKAILHRKPRRRKCRVVARHTCRKSDDRSKGNPPRHGGGGSHTHTTKRWFNNVNPSQDRRHHRKNTLLMATLDSQDHHRYHCRPGPRQPDLRNHRCETCRKMQVVTTACPYNRGSRRICEGSVCHGRRRKAQGRQVHLHAGHPSAQSKLNCPATVCPSATFAQPHVQGCHLQGLGLQRGKCRGRQKIHASTSSWRPAKVLR